MVINLYEFVFCKKDKNKIIYKVIEKNDNRLLLQGINYRRKMEVDSEEVIFIDDEEIKKENKQNEKYLNCYNNYKQRTKKYVLGTVFHLDADKEYLEKCKLLYNDVGIYCFPCLCDEKKLAITLKEMKLNFIPDVIVITGHDYFNGENKKELSNYTNSKYFVEAVKVSKILYPNSIIIAGACQSNFEALIANGASFASSPKRINVHVYDPAIIAIHICTTSFRKVLDFVKLEKYVTELYDAFGGVETFGKMKMLY